MNSIAVDGVGRRVGQRWVVKDVSFEIARGEIFGIYGRSGAGKSTIVRLVAGLDHPCTGAVSLLSAEGGNQSWLDARVSAALQKPGLAQELTIAENLALFTSLWNAPRKRRTGRIAMFTELLGLTEVRNRRVRDLPEGQKAAAEIARALIATAEITVIDGLIERLDRPAKRRVWEYILARRRQGATFIIATSSGDEAEMCDRIAVLTRGQLAFVGTPDELKTFVHNEVVVVESIRNPLLKTKLKGRFQATVTERLGTIEYSSSNPEAEVAEILSDMPSDVGCVYLRQTTLDDALDRIEGD